MVLGIGQSIVSTAPVRFLGLFSFDWWMYVSILKTNLELLHSCSGGMAGTCN